MSYYLKYRPQRVKDLDLTSARDALSAVLSTGEFAHAYLFSGPKGTGKTSSARILAKVLNCVKNQDLVGKKPLKEPCGVCTHCTGIQTGNSMAVLELDAASNRGIDDIRQLKERIALAPAEGQRMVYVIDEVHMLTTEAFNAFLKTLEEPPKHAVFVLCTTEPQKLPDTVISRCTRINFRKAQPEEVMASLEKVVQSEKLKVDAPVLRAIAERVDGSFRDGMKILEQLVHKADRLTLEVVDEFTGYSDIYQAESLVTALVQLEVQQVLNSLQEKSEQGVDFGLFSKRLAESLRRGLIKAVSEKSSKAEIQRLTFLTERFARAALEVKTAVIPQLPLEIAAVEWCLKETKNDHSVAEEKNKKIPLREPEREFLRKQSKLDELKKEVKEEDQQVEADKNDLPENEETPRVRKPTGAVSLDVVKLNWAQVLKAVKPHNHSLEALLKATQPMKVQADNLVIEVFYMFHKEQLEQERHRKTIEQIVESVLGCRLKLQFVLGKKAVPTAEIDERIANVTGNVSDEELAEAAEEIFGN